MAPEAHSLSRFAAALLLLAAAVVVQLETVAAQDDPCVPFDETCKEDAECRACIEVVGTNVKGFEECQLYYGFSADVCVNQSAQPCCQNEASATDCLANVAYVNFYECRLEQDVFGGECTVLNCDAVGGAKTESDTDTATDDATDADANVDADAGADDDVEVDAVVTDDDVDAEGAEDDDANAETSTTDNSVGRLAPFTTSNKTAGFLMATALSAVAVVVASAFV